MEITGRNIRILLIEDDICSREIISPQMNENGFDVTCAEDGVQAMEMIKHVAPDCILLDMLMPRMHGFKFLKQFRSENKDLPVIIISSLEDQPELIAAMETLGIEGWFPKPINVDEIIKIIKKLFGPKP